MERIRFFRVVDREPKNCGMHVKAVVPDEVDKWARVLKMALEERNEPRYVHYCYP